MKPSGNESLHRPDHYVTEIFSAGLPPTEALKVRVITSQRYASVPFLGRLPHETWSKQKLTLHRLRNGM